jgi:two-component system, OmpR family, alkaline phosphatase synthesis response regulator PhoP
MTKILLVEDSPDLAYGLATSLEIEGYQVEVADDGRKGLDRAKALRPDLVILDLMIPQIDGYKVLKMMRESGLDTPVLILTARGAETDKVLGFRLGADDYVTKPFGLSELLARVQAILRRAKGNDRADGGRPAVERFGTVEVNPASRVVTKDGVQVPLTPKALDLLLALLKRNGAVASRIELLREVWGHQADVVTRTVDIHVAELRRKLEDDASEPRHIITVWKAGYRLER